MTRVSTAQSFDTTVNRLVKRQSELSDSQERLTSGKRVIRASDDPAAAARAERALASISHIEATQRGVQASQSVMLQTESALGAAGDLMQRAREIVVSAGNASYSDAERQAMGRELATIREDLMQVANRSDGANGFLFGGQGSLQPPFVQGAGGMQYAGDGGKLQVGSELMPLSFDGESAWMTAPTGNGIFETQVTTSTGSAVIDAGRIVDASAYYAQPPSTYDITFNVAAGTPTTYVVTRTPLPPAAPVPVAGAPQAYTSGHAIQVDGMSINVTGAPANGDQFGVVPSTQSLSVFDAVDKAIAELATTNRSSTQIAQRNAQNLANFDSVMSRLQLTRSDAGNALNLIDGTSNRLDDQKLQGVAERSDAEDLDMVSAISDFQNKQTGYDAALKSYAMVQKMSLFQYLSS